MDRAEVFVDTHSSFKIDHSSLFKRGYIGGLVDPKVEREREKTNHHKTIEIKVYEAEILSTPT